MDCIKVLFPYQECFTQIHKNIKESFLRIVIGYICLIYIIIGFETTYKNIPLESSVTIVNHSPIKVEFFMCVMCNDWSHWATVWWFLAAITAKPDSWPTTMKWPFGDVQKHVVLTKSYKKMLQLTLSLNHLETYKQVSSKLWPHYWFKIWTCKEHLHEFTIKETCIQALELQENL